MHFDFSRAKRLLGMVDNLAGKPKSLPVRRSSEANDVPRSGAARNEKQAEEWLTKSAGFLNSNSLAECKLGSICCAKMASRLKPRPRSGCPVSISLEMLGDRWSLLIVRDLMVRGYRRFKQFQQSGEGIATNVLADRLRRLQSAGIITAEHDEKDGREINYRLTEKGIDLAPVLLELLIWGARHEKTGASCALLLKMERNREQILREARRRWCDRDDTPLIPSFTLEVARSLAREVEKV